MATEDSSGTDDLNSVLEKISSQLRQQEQTLTQLKGKYDSLTSDLDREAAVRAVAVETNRMEKEHRAYIDETIGRLTKVFAFVGFLVSALAAAVGYVGMDKYIPEMIEQRLNEQVAGVKEKITGDSTREILNRSEKEIFEPATRNLQQIEVLLGNSRKSLQTALDYKNEYEKNDLIVLQTDFGAKSPYMGILKGAIYQINDRARIDVITEEVPPFETLDAAWILSRAIELYPENTIFVSITGDPGSSLRRPVIVHTKERQYTFVGYLNGVFDFAVDPDEDLTIYTVNWEKFRDLWSKRSKRLPNPETTGTAEILGYVAGALSRTQGPWERELDHGIEFPWLEVVKPAEYVKNEKLKNTEPSYPTEPDADGTFHVEGTIMHIDRYGNANTNIERIQLDRFLPTEWETSPKLVMLAGVQAESVNDSSVPGGTLPSPELKTLPFTTDYSTVDVCQPILTTDSGKLQLALAFGNFADNNPLRSGYQAIPGPRKLGQACSHGDKVQVQTGDKVVLKIKRRRQAEYRIICDDGVVSSEECRELSQ